jgi:hypothetical protein
VWCPIKAAWLSRRHNLLASFRACPGNATHLKGSFTLLYGTPKLAIAGPRSASKIRPLLLEAKRRFPMNVAGRRFAHVKRTLRVRAVLVGLLEELPFVCPVVVAISSTVMILIKLCKDLPQ